MRKVCPAIFFCRCAAACHTVSSLSRATCIPSCMCRWTQPALPRPAMTSIQSLRRRGHGPRPSSAAWRAARARARCPRPERHAIMPSTGPTFRSLLVTRCVPPRLSHYCLDPHIEISNVVRCLALGVPSVWVLSPHMSLSAFTPCIRMHQTRGSVAAVPV
jgi:hypothetical protein